MPTFKIEWEQELDSFVDPLEAVKECIKDISNGETLMFTVTDMSSGKVFSVDGECLDPEDAVVEITHLIK